MDLGEFKDSYTSVLEAFVETQLEQHLAAAAELGRKMVAAGVPPEDVAEVHEDAVRRLEHKFADRPLLDYAGRISAPLAEVLMAYGLAFRNKVESLTVLHEELCRSESRYRSIFELAGNLIISVTRGGTIVDCNARVTPLLGYGRDELVGRPISVILCPEDAAAVPEIVETVTCNGYSHDRECAFLAKDGSRVDASVSIASLRDERGECTGAICIVTDMTTRKQTERERDALLRLHKSTMDAVPSSLLVLDAELKVVVANRQFLEVHEVREADVVGRHVKDVISELLSSVPSLLAGIERVAGQHRDRYEVTGVKYSSPRDETRYVDVRICAAGLEPSQDGERESRLLVVIDDVTERCVLEEERDRLDRLDSIGRLTGGIAHDFNNLITGITGYAQLLLGQLAHNPKMSRDVQQIRELADRAAHLTRQLLAFSRRQTLRPVVLNINDLVENISKMLRRIIGEDIRFEFVPDGNLGNVRADATQIEQVIMNLAVNARDAMPDGGTLTIETANVVLDREYAESRPGVKPGRYVMLAVTDTGCGMDSATQKRIFEPFYTTKAQQEGTGLGLSTVYGIVKQHGGNIWVYSEPGEGTVFKVYLPLVSAAVEAGVESAELEAKLPAGTETVLVVEDEDGVRTIIERTLGECGYTVLTAANPEQAERVYAEHIDEVDLLLTDVVLPDMRGPALYDRLAADDPSLKVLYCSGYTDTGIVMNGVLSGSAPFLQKPFTPAGLAEKVREVLDMETGQRTEHTGGVSGDGEPDKTSWCSVT